MTVSNTKWFKGAVSKHKCIDNIEKMIISGLTPDLQVCLS